MESLVALRWLVSEQQRQVSCLSELTKNLVLAHFGLKEKVATLEEEFVTLKCTLQGSGAFPIEDGQPLEDLLQEPMILSSLALSLGLPAVSRLCAASQSCQHSVILGAKDMCHLDGLAGLEELHDAVLTEAHALQLQANSEATEQLAHMLPADVSAFGAVVEGRLKAHALQLRANPEATEAEPRQLEGNMLAGNESDSGEGSLEGDVPAGSDSGEEVQNLATPLVILDEPAEWQDSPLLKLEPASVAGGPERPGLEEEDDDDVDSMPPLVKTDEENSSQTMSDELEEDEHERYSLAPQLIMVPQAVRNPGAKAEVEKASQTTSDDEMPPWDLSAIIPTDGEGSSPRQQRPQRPEALPGRLRRREGPRNVEADAAAGKGLPKAVEAHSSILDLAKQDEISLAGSEGTSWLRPGQRAQLAGLCKRPELNGVVGRIACFCEQSQRWCVAVPSFREHIRVRAVNLRSVPSQSEAEESLPSSRSLDIQTLSSVEASRFPQLFKMLNQCNVPDEWLEEVSPLDGLGKAPRSRWSLLASEGAVVVAGGVAVAAPEEAQASAGVFCLMPSRRDAWMRLPDLGKARCNAAVATVGAEVYVIGGRAQGSGESGVVERFSSQSPTWEWETMPPMVETRSAASVAVVDSDVYVAGGLSGHGKCLRLFDRLHTPSATWQRLPPLFHGRFLATASSVAGDVYVYAGFGSSRACLGSMERYSPSVEAWTGICKMPGGTLYFATVVDRHFLYILGGERGDGQPLALAHRFDARRSTSQGACERLPPMRSPRSGAAAAATPSGDLLVCGGCVGTVDTALSSVEILRLPAAHWETLQPMRHARVFPSCALLGSVLYVLGGIGEGARDCEGMPQAASSVELFDLREECWSDGPSAPIPLMSGCSVCLRPLQDSS